MRNDRALIVLAACAFAWPMLAAAQNAAPASANGASAPAEAVSPRAAVMPTAGAMAAANELMRLQEDTVVLKAELKKLDAQAQIAEREEALRRMGHTQTYEEVFLLATQSLGKTMSATVRTSDGSEFDVRAGDTLPNGARVMSIRSGAMVIEADGGHRMTLTVSGARKPSSPIAAAAGAGYGVPPIPTLPMSAR
ncbi:MAG TPA: type IV pilus biogenesis protein PilP [Trinickia sp.]|jgi:type IV pilus biogenesis protein PilP|nr:type IV pilus biogenesis protein PilP [Trinickia sp.]